MKKLSGISLALLGLIALAMPSHAQTIAWGSASNMTGNTDIVIPIGGTLVDAATFYSHAGVTSLTVNTGAGNVGGSNVTFNLLTGSGTSTDGNDITVTTPGGVGPYAGTFPATGSSSVAYQNLVSPEIGFTVGVTGTVTLTGLIPTDTYQVEAWSFYTSSAPKGGVPGATMLTGSTSVNLASAAGQYALGTFTANGTSETFGYAVNNGDNHAVLNAITLYNTTGAAVPEPSTYVLLGLGFLGLVVLRKRFARI